MPQYRRARGPGCRCMSGSTVEMPTPPAMQTSVVHLSSSACCGALWYSQLQKVISHFRNATPAARLLPLFQTAFCNHLPPYHQRWGIGRFLIERSTLLRSYLLSGPSIVLAIPLQRSEKRRRSLNLPSPPSFAASERLQITNGSKPFVLAVLRSLMNEQKGG